MMQLSPPRDYVWVPVVTETPLIRPTMNFSRIEYGPAIPNDFQVETPPDEPPQNYAGAAGTINNHLPAMFTTNEAPLVRSAWNFDTPGAASRVVMNGNGRSGVPGVGQRGQAKPGGETPLLRPKW